MNNKTFALAISALLTVQATAQTEVSTYKPGITPEGVTYFLPKTALRVAVTVKKTHYTPGEFSEYAERFLRIKDAPKTAYDKWDIEKVEVFPYGEADKTKAFTVKLKAKTSAPLVELATDGRLLSINTKATESDATLPTAKIIRKATDGKSGSDYKTEEILSAGSMTKMAELTANEIYDIRENRLLLTKGQADFMPKDGEQLKLMLANLDEQEEGLLCLFKGTSSEETHVYTFDLCPTTEIAKETLFCFSKYLGITDNDDPAGRPFFISVTDLKTLPVAVAQEEGKKKEAEDVRYLIPSRAQIRVFSDEKELASVTIPMAQFGRTEHLGGDLFNKKYTTKVQISPVTGNIVKIEAAQPE